MHPENTTINCAIVTIGTELLLGQIIDTNASYLARELNRIGLPVVLHTTVGDNYTQIRDALSEALKRTDLVMTTGGLGPTEDDLTREVIADLVGSPLTFKKELMRQIESIFERLGYRMPENNRKQAFIPDGAIPITNEVGTAPGFIVQKASKVIVTLPGVPRELKYLLSSKVIPELKKRFHLHQERISSKVLKVTGIGESKVDSHIKDLIKTQTNPTVGILASPGDISIIITASAKNAKQAESLIVPIEQEIRSRLGIAVYGIDDDTLHGVVINRLNKRRETLSIVETFTGGILTARLCSSLPSPVNESIVIGKREQLLSFLNTKRRVIDGETGEALATKIRTMGNSSVGLALLGSIKPIDKAYEVHAHVVISGRDVNGSYEWKMGGDIPTLQNRGATIGLNTLRLALIS
jgi:nicotinamide-nucleotide amidase